MSVYFCLNDHWLGDDLPHVGDVFNLDGYALDDACEDETYYAAREAAL